MDWFLDADMVWMGVLDAFHSDVLSYQFLLNLQIKKRVAPLFYFYFYLFISFYILRFMYCLLLHVL